MDRPYTSRAAQTRIRRQRCDVNVVLRNECFTVRVRRVVVALLVVGAAAVGAVSAHAESVSSNWAGYAVADSSTIETGESTAPLVFTSVTATWKQPRARCSAGRATYSAFWVGLGGYGQ